MISIATLIYKSTRFADALYESVYEFTPHLKDGGAEFFFVANDASNAVLDHLKAKNYRHFINTNPVITDKQLKAKGFAPPEYIRRVYRGYNLAIKESKGEIVVLLNSDHFFSPLWLDNLLKNLTRQRVVSSQLVERKHSKYPIFPGAYHAEFGNHPDNYDKEGFLRYCVSTKRDALQPGGAYMPCAFYKDVALKAGLYPEGNVMVRDPRKLSLTHRPAYPGENFVIHSLKGLRYVVMKNAKSYLRPSYSTITGDAYFFARLKSLGVEHVTACDSIVYHLKEGEMDN